MKSIILAVTLLVAISLVACTISPTTTTQTAGSNITPASTQSIPTITPTQTTLSNAAEEVKIRDLVENFGTRLQNVPLQAPDAAQEMQKQYAEFVSPALLEMWMNDISKAPGRIVSSPWPDRIEINTLSKENSDRYTITGFVIEITSTEVTSGEAAAKIPVRMVVQRGQERWLLTEYTEEQ